MGRSTIAVLVAAALSQGCFMIGAGLGYASAEDKPITPEAYRACLIAKEQTPTRNCADASTYPELRARPGRDARWGAVIGLGLDALAVTLIFVAVTSTPTH